VFALSLRFRRFVVPQPLRDIAVRYAAGFGAALVVRSEAIFQRLRMGVLLTIGYHDPGFEMNSDSWCVLRVQWGRAISAEVAGEDQKAYRELDIGWV